MLGSFYTPSTIFWQQKQQWKMFPQSSTASLEPEWCPHPSPGVFRRPQTTSSTNTRLPQTTLSETLNQTKINQCVFSLNTTTCWYSTVHYEPTHITLASGHIGILHRPIIVYLCERLTGVIQPLWMLCTVSQMATLSHGRPPEPSVSCPFKAPSWCCSLFNDLTAPSDRCQLDLYESRVPL